MDIQRGLSAEEYQDIGERLSKLGPNELLNVFTGLRAGHDQRRQMEGTSGFLGSDRYLSVAMDRLAEHALHMNGGKSGACEPQMMG
jgi:hypothetical protein